MKIKIRYEYDPKFALHYLDGIRKNGIRYCLTCNRIRWKKKEVQS